MRNNIRTLILLLQNIKVRIHAIFIVSEAKVTAKVVKKKKVLFYYDYILLFSLTIATSSFWNFSLASAGWMVQQDPFAHFLFVIRRVDLARWTVMIVSCTLFLVCAGLCSIYFGKPEMIMAYISRRRGKNNKIYKNK